MGKELSGHCTGVFADQPENTDLKYDVIVSFATLYKRMGEDRAGWGYDISYMGVVRFIMIRKLLRGLPDGYRKCRKVSSAGEGWFF